MSGKNIFDFRDYKAYLNHVLSQMPSRGHGLRSRFAKHLRVQPGYISQVLNSGAHFSPEQAEDLNHFLNHTEEESDYFLLLVQLNRAGSVPLKQRIQKQMDLVLSRRADLQTRVQIKKRLSIDEQSRYYSSWQFAAVHILTTIPRFRTPDSISQALGLSTRRTKIVIEELTKIGLLEKKGQEFHPGETLLYLSNEAALISKHHCNWRVRALEALEEINDENLHFSVVTSISKEDRRKLRNFLAGAVEDFMKVVKSSSEEELHALNIDFFNLLNHAD
jgi:uncharacterized protein (TIGR02147 family)